MAVTAEQFYNTVQGTPDAAGLDIPAQKENTQPPAQAESAQETAAATPNTEQAKPTGEEAQAPPATTFNLDEELEKISGGAIKTKDEIARLLETSRKVGDLESRSTTLQQENEQLKAKAEANPFANDFTKKLNDLYAAGANDSQVQAFMAINKVDIDALTPMQTTSLALQIKHGLSPEEADRYIAKKYDIDLSDPDTGLSDDAKIALKVDSSADKDFLKTHKAQVSETPVDRSQQEQRLQQEAYTQKVAKLEPIAQQTLSKILETSFKGISVNGKEGDGAITIDLPISEESKNALAKVTADLLSSNWDRLSPDDKGAAAIRQFNENVIVQQNWKNWLVDVASKTELRVRAEYTNASPINRGQAAEPAGKTKEQERVDGISSTLARQGYL